MDTKDYIMSVQKRVETRIIWIGILRLSKSLGLLSLRELTKLTTFAASKDPTWYFAYPGVHFILQLCEKRRPNAVVEMRY